MNSDKNITNIDIDKIIPNRFQPRLIFDEKLLENLAASIEKHGIIQPLIVRPLNDKFEIIAGERRYKAACLCGLKTVPVIIKQIPDSKSAELAVIENVQRKDLNPIEEAKSYKNLLNNNNQTQEQLAKELGINQSTIANKLRLLNLTNEVQEALSYEKISERHARALLKINNEAKQIELLNRTINERLTVKDLDNIIKEYQTQVSTPQEELLTPVTQEKDTSNKEQISDEIENILPELNEEIDTLETLDIVTPTKKALNFSNIFTPIEEEKYPSLDDLITNMDIGIEDDILGPFINEEEEVVLSEPKVEVNDAVVLSEIPKEPEPIIKPDNLDSVKEAFAKLNEEIKNNGYSINFEDFDFSDIYQVIIKIDKQKSN